MDTEEALRFLRANQPLPSDQALGERIRVFDAVRKHFTAQLDPRCIPLLLNAFGEGSGFGVYQLVEDTIAQYPAKHVLPALQQALHSPHRSVRYWNAQIAALFPDATLIEHLTPLLGDDEDLRFAAVMALSRIHDPQIVPLLQAQLAAEQSAEIRAFITEVLAQ